MVWCLHPSPQFPATSSPGTRNKAMLSSSSRCSRIYQLRTLLYLVPHTISLGRHLRYVGGKQQVRRCRWSPAVSDHLLSSAKAPNDRRTHLHRDSTPINVSNVRQKFEKVHQICRSFTIVSYVSLQSDLWKSPGCEEGRAYPRWYRVTQASPQAPAEVTHFSFNPQLAHLIKLVKGLMNSWWIVSGVPVWG